MKLNDVLRESYLKEYWGADLNDYAYKVINALVYNREGYRGREEEKTSEEHGYYTLNFDIPKNAFEKAFGDMDEAKLRGTFKKAFADDINSYSASSLYFERVVGIEFKPQGEMVRLSVEVEEGYDI